MGVQWETRPANRRIGPAFITFPPDRIVRVLSSPDQHAVVAIHWVAADKTSVPCTGDECKLCPQAKRICAYGAAMVWSPRLRKWMQGILPFGSSDTDVANIDLRGYAAILGRTKDVSGPKRIVYLGRPATGDVAELPDAPTFDVRPFLLRRWGLFKEADLIGCEFHPPQPTLFTGEEKAS